MKFRKNRRKIELQDIKIGMHLTHPNYFPLWVVLNNTRFREEIDRAVISQSKSANGQKIELKLRNMQKKYLE